MDNLVQVFQANPLIYIAAPTLLVLVWFLRDLNGGGKPDYPPSVLKQQSISSRTRKPGESAIYRSRQTPHGGPLLEGIAKFPHIKTLYDGFQNGIKQGKGPSKNCLGTRINDGPYVWESYAEIADRVTNFGSGLLECGLVPAKEQFVGMFAKNCAEWIITQLSCISYSLVIVPLYDTLGQDAIEFIINQTKMSVVVVASDKLPLFMEVVPKCPSLKYIIKIGTLTADDKKLAKDAKISLLYFKGVEALGKDSPKPHVPPKPDDIFNVCYTSGTTGNPKGVMLNHKNLVAECGALLASFPSNFELGVDDVHLSFLPLAHIFEQMIAGALLGLGASIAFYRGDVLKLLEDIAVVRPTIFPTVPRLLNRIYDRVLGSVNDLLPHRRYIFFKALESKRQLLRQGILRNDTIWDKLVFRKVRDRLGGRVRLLVTGAAPIAADVLDFMRCCLGCQVLEGYGQTETSAAVSVTMFGDYSTEANGHVGAVLPCCEIKLVDIPDMGYTADDKPNPRGEICIRGNNVFKGYYKLPDKTREALDDDGWCHTGDVGMFLPNGSLKIIDRKKHLFKLSQGEYIAPEKIENIYVKSKFVAQAFVYGDSLKSALVGVIVPDHAVLLEWAKARGRNDGFHRLVQDPEVKRMIQEDIVALGKSSKLHSFEQVKEIALETEEFTVENGMLTPSMKAKRDQLKKKYEKTISELYLKLEK